MEYRKHFFLLSLMFFLATTNVSFGQNKIDSVEVISASISPDESKVAIQRGNRRIEVWSFDGILLAQQRLLSDDKSRYWRGEGENMMFSTNGDHFIYSNKQLTAEKWFHFDFSGAQPTFSENKEVHPYTTALTDDFRSIFFDNLDGELNIRIKNLKEYEYTNYEVKQTKKRHIVQNLKICPSDNLLYGTFQNGKWNKKTDRWETNYIDYIRIDPATGVIEVIAAEQKYAGDIGHLVRISDDAKTFFFSRGVQRLGYAPVVIDIEAIENNLLEGNPVIIPEGESITNAIRENLLAYVKFLKEDCHYGTEEPKKIERFYFNPETGMLLYKDLERPELLRSIMFTSGKKTTFESSEIQNLLSSEKKRKQDAILSEKQRYADSIYIDSALTAAYDASQELKSSLLNTIASMQPEKDGSLKTEWLTNSFVILSEKPKVDVESRYSFTIDEVISFNGDIQNFWIGALAKTEDVQKVKVDVYLRKVGSPASWELFKSTTLDQAANDLPGDNQRPQNGSFTGASILWNKQNHPNNNQTVRIVFSSETPVPVGVRIVYYEPKGSTTTELNQWELQDGVVESVLRQRKESGHKLMYHQHFQVYKSSGELGMYYNLSAGNYIVEFCTASKYVSTISAYNLANGIRSQATQLTHFPGRETFNFNPSSDTMGNVMFEINDLDFASVPLDVFIWKVP